MTPFSFGDSAIAITTHAYSTPMLSGVSPPEICCLALSLVVRSALITFQEFPPSVVRWTNWLPAYSVFRSCGDMWNGIVQLNRYLMSAGGHPSGLSGQISTLRDMPVFVLCRTTMPPTLPEPDAVDQTSVGSTGSGVANPLSPPPTLDHMLRGMLPPRPPPPPRSEEHTSELQSRSDLVCRLLLEKKNYGAYARPGPCSPFPRTSTSERSG